MFTTTITDLPEVPEANKVLGDADPKKKMDGYRDRDHQLANLNATETQP